MEPEMISAPNLGPSNFGSGDPEGLAYDSVSNALFIADGVGEEVYRIDAGPNSIFDGVAPGGDDIVAHFDTSSLGIRDPEGIEFDPDSGLLYILSSRDPLIAETLPNGTLVRYIDISAANSIAAAGSGLWTSPVRELLTSTSTL